MKLKIKKEELPKIIDNKSKQKVKESGCCFRSCGGAPGIQQINLKASKTSFIKKLLSKIE